MMRPTHFSDRRILFSRCRAHGLSRSVVLHNELSTSGCRSPEKRACLSMGRSTSGSGLRTIDTTHATTSVTMKIAIPRSIGTTGS